MSICISHQIDEAALQSFLSSNEWYDWLTRDEVQHLVRSAVHASVAEHEGRVVGFLLLIGDGRIMVELDSLVVAKAHRGKGIGTKLMQDALNKVEELGPHFFQMKAKSSELDGFYSRFGFVQETDQIVLSHQPTAEKLHQRTREQRPSE